MKKKTNLTLDVHSKRWWLSIGALALILVQQICHVFGWELPDGTANDLTGLLNTILALAGAVGLVTDTTKEDK